MKEKCYDCSQVAQWLYAPGKNDPEGVDYYCDDCVPRGCSCNLTLKDGVEEIMIDLYEMNPDEDYYQPLDENGREYPCCEFLFSEKGWNKDA